MQFLPQAKPHLLDLKRGLRIDTFLPPRKLARARNTEKKFKRNTDKMSFVIIHAALKYLFQRIRKNKKKE